MGDREGVSDTLAVALGDAAELGDEPLEGDESGEAERATETVCEVDVDSDGDSLGTSDRDWLAEAVNAEGVERVEALTPKETLTDCDDDGDRDAEGVTDGDRDVDTECDELPVVLTDVE